jgi:hypothetical protein
VYKQNASLLNSEIQQAVLQSVTGPLGQDELAAGLFAIGNIFPNPVSGVAVTNIKVTASGKLMIDITDMNGQLIKPVAGKQLLPGFYDVTFETAGMAPGQYLLRVTSNGQVRSKQFTVLKQ